VESCERAEMLFLATTVSNLDSRVCICVFVPSIRFLLGGDLKGKNIVYAHRNSVIIRNIDVKTSLTVWGIP
jgi:hypothetical protein